MPKSSDVDVGTKTRQSKRKNDLQDSEFHDSPRRRPKSLIKLGNCSGEGTFGGWRLSPEQILPEPTGSSEGREGELRFESQSPPISPQQVELAPTESNALPSGKDHKAFVSTTPGYVFSSRHRSSRNVKLNLQTNNTSFSRNSVKHYHNTSHPDNNGIHAGINSSLLGLQVPGHTLQHRRQAFSRSRASRMLELARRSTPRSVSSDPASAYGRHREMLYYPEASSRESLLWTVDPAAEQAATVNRASGHPSSDTNQNTPDSYTSTMSRSSSSSNIAPEPSPLTDFLPLQSDFEFGTNINGQHDNHFGQKAPEYLENHTYHNTGYSQHDYYASANQNTEVVGLDEFGRMASGDTTTSTDSTNSVSMFPSQTTGYPQQSGQQSIWTQDNRSATSLVHGQSTLASSSSYPYATFMEENATEDSGSTVTLVPAQHGHSYAMASEYQYPNHNVLPQQTYNTHFVSPNKFDASQFFELQNAQSYKTYPYNSKN
ncbi:hypothetical protein J3R30DRAFT_3473728 [Lentinula aciculospora]|uniref:Uncharacterized protein n=1 Tax=Lentinula aciculospora TaxID=153920 RepID=A0A9W9DNQ8_9AGAR|nr:hypothetical protein J3R30DRAFT_3473728 [Lentinula aciculospora]